MSKFKKGDRVKHRSIYSDLILEGVIAECDDDGSYYVMHGSLSGQWVMGEDMSLVNPSLFITVNGLPLYETTTDIA